jgi:ABC-2 type transport system ATP-binding protein
MDEAARCHALAYIFNGRLLARGTGAELVAQARLVACEVRGPADALAALAKALRADPALSSVAWFGPVLRLAATSPEALEAALARAQPAGGGVTALPSEPNLEDVFIALMHTAGT